MPALADDAAARSFNARGSIQHGEMWGALFSNASAALSRRARARAHLVRRCARATVKCAFAVTCQVHGGALSAGRFMRGARRLDACFMEQPTFFARAPARIKERFI